ncbi:hypothetical protein PHYBLDRAFT_172530 [Phycomyces blakesleeanus NRRL 1555(-)]|uniref:Uncharacterized protein n=1 Tax=Phycomyces blakesleeanus (strain ATCC 8743b / DSM 1359 / FGSC 10004 / NBRC 33097 / NRRL 1555) TaxID=763407 RepID=A0A167L036_PHYB8|nr:hypothetical protein PHYBLDRAFT_172530 [Phycomyces blakesleeanus NRRL 1555(-)]OAD69279.1 hypothetical protein PHYBLDRAFT_172530 [Phycomyces blakesleeanus NRRL 1555(-)]|eukprot:XP_018287319.1 hypothetical protein PHYBLDRAFT_172530 [Phycomyces blakesleeanus NRRL 1555(-)]
MIIKNLESTSDCCTETYNKKDFPQTMKHIFLYRHYGHRLYNPRIIETETRLGQSHIFPFKRFNEPQFLSKCIDDSFVFWGNLTITVFSASQRLFQEFCACLNIQVALISVIVDYCIYTLSLINRVSFL